MTVIRNRAGALVEILRKLSLPYQNTTLFNPLRISISNGSAKVENQSTSKTSFIRAQVNLGVVEGDGDVTIDSLEMLKFLSLYKSEEEITITIGEVVTIQGTSKKSTIYPQALVPLVPPNLPQLKEGVLQYKSGPAVTFVEVEAAELASLIDDAQTVEVASFPLQFSPEGSTVSLGGLEAKKNSILSKVNAVVTGGPSKTTIGEDFVFAFKNITGKVKLQLKDAHPLMIQSDNGVGQFMYLLGPRKE